MTLKKIATVCFLLAAAVGALASSHREAPLISDQPKVDGRPPHVSKLRNRQAEFRNHSCFTPGSRTPQSAPRCPRAAKRSR